MLLDLFLDGLLKVAEPFDTGRKQEPLTMNDETTVGRVELASTLIIDDQPATDALADLHFAKGYRLARVHAMEALLEKGQRGMEFWARHGKDWRKELELIEAIEWSRENG